MPHVLRRLKTTEVLSSYSANTVPDSFATAMAEQKFDATPDAESVLLAMDRLAPPLSQVAANDDMRQYVLLSVETPKDEAYVIKFAQRLENLGWKLFFDRNSLLRFACEEFQFALTAGCDSVSIPLRIHRELMVFTAAPQGRGLLLDVHPMTFAGTQFMWAVVPGENILVRR